MDVDHKYVYNFYTKYCLELKNYNSDSANFDVIPDKFDADNIFSSVISYSPKQNIIIVIIIINIMIVTRNILTVSRSK